MPIYSNYRYDILKIDVMQPHTVTDVLKAISDGKSRDMFCSIAKNNVESEVLKRTKGLTTNVDLNEKMQDLCYSEHPCCSDRFLKPYHNT